MVDASDGGRFRSRDSLALFANPATGLGILQFFLYWHEIIL